MRIEISGDRMLISQAFSYRMLSVWKRMCMEIRDSDDVEVQILAMVILDAIADFEVRRDD